MADQQHRHPRRLLAWLTWCAALLTMATLHFFSNTAASFALLLATATLAPLLTLCVLLSARGITLTLNAPSASAISRDCPATLSVRGSAFVPLATTRCTITGKNCLTAETFTHDLFVAVGRKETTRPFTFTTPHCGVVQLTATARVEDALGLVSRRIQARAQTHTGVSPEPFAIQLSLSQNNTTTYAADTYAPDRPGADPAETWAIREYRPGDSPRAIHWKLSHKTQKLMVREYGLPQSRQVTIHFMNTTRGEHPLSSAHIHAMAATTFALSQALLAQNIPHVLSWTDSSRNAFGESVQRTISTQSEAQASLSALLKNRVRPLDGEEAAAACAPEFLPHTVVVGTHLPTELADGSGETQVTLLTPHPTPQRARGWVCERVFSENNYRDELSFLEI